MGSLHSPSRASSHDASTSEAPPRDGVQNAHEAGRVGARGARGAGGSGGGGLTVAQPFAASLVASVTEGDVNGSPPIMYILTELLNFLVRFGLSVGARKVRAHVRAHAHGTCVRPCL